MSNHSAIVNCLYDNFPSSIPNEKLFYAFISTDNITIAFEKTAMVI